MLNTILNADVWFENMLLGVRTPFFLHLFNWVTFFGNTIVVVAVTGIVGICLLLSQRFKAYAGGLAAAVIGASGASYILKILVGRARPSGLIPSAIETSFSFPSGHTTLAMTLYGFLAYLLCKLYPKNAAAIVTLATLVIFVIGFSRLYLGLHFPTDVLGGYLLGGLWLLIGIKITALLKRDAIVR
ncbi:MAG: phosphatase PAP2 family protein [Candidatus Kaiserbacteria bacterium]|nr:phosphatase PAP2 family protein [Candidatus Kaiserbacteria bacterium]